MSVWSRINSFGIRCDDGNLLSYKKSEGYANRIENKSIVFIVIDRLKGELYFVINNVNYGVAI